MSQAVQNKQFNQHINLNKSFHYLYIFFSKLHMLKFNTKKSSLKLQENSITSLQRVKSQKLISYSQLDTQTCSQTPRQKGVRFSESLIDTKPVKQSYRSTSILKQSKYKSKNEKVFSRSQSVTSLGGQNPSKDDQGCQCTAINKKIKEQYDIIMKKYCKKGSFRDQIFPPSSLSIRSNTDINKQKYENIKWMRICEVFPNNQLTIYGYQPGRLEIKSSNLVADYFGLGLNCLKFSKNLLKKIFEEQKINIQGVYYAKVFSGNVWKYILVDDYIPVVEGSGRKNQPIYQPAFINPAFNKKNGDQIQIWSLIIEKVFAKIYTNYATLQKGNIFDFLEQLTNSPYQFFDLSNKQTNFKQIYQAKQLVAFGQTKQGDKIPLQIGVGQSQKIMFLKKDKKLIIESTQMKKYFEGIYIFSGKNYSYTGYCPVKQTKQSISVRKFTLYQKTQISLTLYQKDQKFFKSSKDFMYVWVRMLLFQKQYNGSYRWIDGRYDCFKSLTVEGDLQSGDYYVIIIPQWDKIHRFIDLNLIIRCKFPTIIDRMAYKTGIIEEGCTDLAQRFGVLNQLNKDICSYNCIHQDLGLIIENFNNQRQKGCVRITKKIILDHKSVNQSKDQLKLCPINDEFKKNHKAQITIKGQQYYTLVLITKGGVNREALQKFNFTV